MEATYTTNAFGMRDQARTKDKARPRVAVLGDSFVEGYLVDDDQTFTRVMQDRVFEGSTEVLTSGTSGFFGTTQQWLVYEHLARDSPDVVVVAFLNENDLFDCSWAYCKTNHRVGTLPHPVHRGPERLRPLLSGGRGPGRVDEPHRGEPADAHQLPGAPRRGSARLRYTGQPPGA